MSAASDPRDPVEEMYTAHQGWLRTWLRRKVGSHDQAADLAHDTFAKVLANRAQVVTIREPRAYLTTLARRLLIDHARHQEVEQIYLAELAKSAQTMDMEPSPEEIHSAVQALRHFSDALTSLSPKVREAFLLHYINELTQPEVAIKLGVSVRMVQKYLAQALLKCQAAFNV